MDNRTTEKKYTSIADCAICNRIPQKVAEDIIESPKIIPPQVNELGTVVEIEDESTHAYCTSITRLLKCPVCGTYYYYNHYDDDGEHFMDPTCDEITVRRYDPLTALSFLERIAAGSENALPNTLGQLKTAFAEGTSAPATQIATAGLSDKLQATRQELGELRGRYDEIIRDLGEVIQHRSLDWQIKMYAVESLCHHFLSRGNWDSMSRLLLHHADPVVRVSTANLVIGIATDDAPVIDLVHTTRSLRTFLAAEIAKKVRMNELVEALLEIALSGDGVTFAYDHGYGASKYYQQSTRSVALYNLVVAAGHRAELAHAIPALVGLLASDKHLNYYVCWVLRTLVEKRKKSAQVILDEIEKLDRSGKRKLRADEEVEKLVQVCNLRLRKVARDGKRPTDRNDSKRQGAHMNETGQRMLDGSQPPGVRQVAAWLGPVNYKRWKNILRFIETTYPGVFVSDWQFGGQKHGWGLRFKKSKSFCTLIPERNQLRIQIVFGGEERMKAEAILAELVSHAREDYMAATTYHDGKWLGLVVDSDEALADVKRLLTVKRKPKRV